MSSGDIKETSVSVGTRASSTHSVAPSLRSPRAARFAEATTVDSPIEPSQASRAPFAQTQMSNHLQPQPQPSDVGFGYINDPHQSTYGNPGVEVPATPKSPLKSALKSPGAAPRKIENPMSPTFKENPLSPTWREEKLADKTQKGTDKRQAEDLKIKVRVRMAKMVLRGTNFACSLIVLSMLAATFSIFNATVNLPPRNLLPAWAPSTPIWPQITLLVIASISLFMSVVVFYAYFRGGHRRAEKVALYYTTFAVAFFVFSILMWVIGAAVLQQSKTSNQGNDIWGWSCKDNTRKQLFEDEVSYSLVCRMQNWSLVCCVIEVVVELITIMIYGIVFYRYWSKRKLRKSMAVRDRARSDLYLAQLRTQTAPNTPGLPFSPRDGGYNPMFSPRFAPGSQDGLSAAEKGEGVQYVSAEPAPTKPFTLMAAPSKTTPKMQQKGFSGTTTPQSQTSLRPQTPQNISSPMSPSFASRQAEHVPAGPGEQQYGAVPIPGAYASPIQSPSFAPAGSNNFAPLR